MDTDTNDRGKERIVFFPVDHEAVQTIVVEYPVVDAFLKQSLRGKRGRAAAMSSGGEACA